MVGRSFMKMIAFFMIVVMFSQCIGYNQTKVEFSEDNINNSTFAVRKYV